MKRLEIYLAVVLCFFCLAACGGGGNDGGSSGGGTGGGSYIPKTYSQSVTLSAKKGEQVITLSDLSSAVSSVSSTPTWLVISPQYYSSGAPTLKLEFQENTETEERKTTVTVSASSGDKVVLSLPNRQARRKMALMICIVIKRISRLMLLSSNVSAHGYPCALT